MPFLCRGAQKSGNVARTAQGTGQDFAWHRSFSFRGHWLNMTKQLGNLLRFAAKLWTTGRFQLVKCHLWTTTLKTFFASCADPSIETGPRQRQAHHLIGPRKEGSMMWWQVLRSAVIPPSRRDSSMNHHVRHQPSDNTKCLWYVYDNNALKTIPGFHGDAIAATTQFATYDAADENWTGRKGHIDLTAKQWKTLKVRNLQVNPWEVLTVSLSNLDFVLYVLLYQAELKALLEDCHI